MRSEGWILDAYVEGEYAWIWFKTSKGPTILLKERYQPDFYFIPKEGDKLEELAQLIATHPHITSVEVQRKYVTIESQKKTGVLHITVDCLDGLQKVIRDVEDTGQHKAISNLNLPHIQKYLMSRKLLPTQKMQVEYDAHNILKGFRTLNDEWETEPPPFTILVFDIKDRRAIDLRDSRKKIEEIRIYSDDLTVEERMEGCETKILENFQERIAGLDADFLVSNNTSISRLLSRVKLFRQNIQFGRIKSDYTLLRDSIPHRVRGRVWIELDVYLHMGVAGIAERCRFTYAPPQLCSSWSAGKIIDARQCFEAIHKDIIIPNRPSFYKHVSTVKDLAYRDRGGLIISPQKGLHENVGELDFESMFPNIIVKENVSYETVTTSGVDIEKRGFLSRMTEEALKRRLYFKHLKKQFEEGCKEYIWCEQRDLILKQILVCIYGYSGCFANRFNNVSAYEEINRISRDNVVKSLDIALEDGYHLIYADTDSIFVKKKDATKEDYELLARRIGRETDLPITLDHYYKFLVFLSSEADPEIEAARRYFGKLIDGSLYYRGIELRRHDTPDFFKCFQEKLMSILFDAEDLQDIMGIQLYRAKKYVLEVYDRVLNGEIPAEELIIQKFLRKPLNEYSSISPHIAAALQARQKDVPTREGKTIDFIYASYENPNPLRRVLNVELRNGDHNFYDREKYAKLLLDIAETILDIYEFDCSHLKR